jgi:hypothetical protein
MLFEGHSGKIRQTRFLIKKVGHFEKIRISGLSKT